MAEASFLAAFLGGLLTLLAPCGALLVPASLAYGLSGTSTDRLTRWLLFVAGLAAVLLPLGIGAAVVGSLLIVHRSTTVLVLGALLVVLGVVQVRGGVRLVPARLLEHRLTAFHLGLVYGVGGFCSGPLLGGVLTVAATSSEPVLAVALLLAFAVGMALPLVVFATLWQRLELGWLRRRADLLGGVALITLGVGFVVFQGSSGLSGLYADLGITALGGSLEARLAETLGGAGR